MNFKIAGLTDIGQKRKTNQDSIFFDETTKFFAVADGMGGHNGGDIASQMSVRLFKESTPSIDSLYANDPKKFLLDTIQKINHSIYEKGLEDENLKGMGTTISAGIFHDKNLYLANIGDSRTYLVQSGQIFQLTRDHSLVQEKLNLGIYDREAAAKDPQKNVLTRTVGFEPEVSCDIYELEVKPGDVFVTCSDGLHGKVPEPEVLKILSHEHLAANLTPALKELIDHANANGGQDNISVIVSCVIE